MSGLRVTSNKYLHQYLFTEDTALLPELRQIILEYWVPVAFLSYLDTWAQAPSFDANDQPRWYDDHKGVAIAYIQPLEGGLTLENQSFELRCTNWFSARHELRDLMYDECQYFNNRSNLFLNIAIMISLNRYQDPEDREYIGQCFIPIECLDSYSVEISLDNGEDIKLNVLKVIRPHLQKANSILAGEFNNRERYIDSLEQYIMDCERMSQLLEANCND